MKFFLIENIILWLEENNCCWFLFWGMFRVMLQISIFYLSGFGSYKNEAKNFQIFRCHSMRQYYHYLQTVKVRYEIHTWYDVLASSILSLSMVILKPSSSESSSSLSSSSSPPACSSPFGWNKNKYVYYTVKPELKTTCLWRPLFCSPVLLAHSIRKGLWKTTTYQQRPHLGVPRVVVVHNIDSISMLKQIGFWWYHICIGLPVPDI